MVRVAPDDLSTLKPEWRSYIRTAPDRLVAVASRLLPRVPARDMRRRWKRDSGVDR